MLVSSTHLMSKERPAAAGLLRELGMYPTSQAAVQFMLRNPIAFIQITALIVEQERLMLWGDLPCPVFHDKECLSIFHVFPMHEQLGQWDGLRPHPKELWRGEVTPQET